MKKMNFYDFLSEELRIHPPFFSWVTMISKILCEPDLRLDLIPQETG